MTFKEKMEKQLIEVFNQKTTDTIIEMAMANDHNIRFKNMWNDDIENYPRYYIPIIWLSVQTSAVRYIDQLPAIIDDIN